MKKQYLYNVQQQMRGLLCTVGVYLKGFECLKNGGLSIYEGELWR
jgi:hypothetical protein